MQFASLSESEVNNLDYINKVLFIMEFEYGKFQTGKMYLWKYRAKIKK